MISNGLGLKIHAANMTINKIVFFLLSHQMPFVRKPEIRIHIS